MLWPLVVMNLRSLLSIGGLLIIMQGCTAGVPVAPPVPLQSGARIASIDNADHGEILVWVTKEKDGGQQSRTFRLAAEGSLHVLGEYDGIRMATKHGELTWQALEKEVPLAGCEHYDGSPAVPTTGSITTVSMVNVTGDVVQKVIASNPEEGSQIDELEHHVSLLGSVGPYLFIHESSYRYACGAHGNQMSSATIWDAELGMPIEVDSELPGRDKLAEVAKNKLDEDEGTDPSRDEESAKPEPRQFLPVYGEHGVFRLDAQFARFACYTCSDGQWGSYTRSAVVPTDWVPERMRAWVTPPVAVREFLSAHREWRLGGWSKR